MAIVNAPKDSTAWAKQWINCYEDENTIGMDAITSGGNHSSEMDISHVFVVRGFATLITLNPLHP